MPVPCNSAESASPTVREEVEEVKKDMDMTTYLATSEEATAAIDCVTGGHAYAADSPPLPLPPASCGRGNMLILRELKVEVGIGRWMGALSAHCVQ